MKKPDKLIEHLNSYLSEPCSGDDEKIIAEWQRLHPDSQVPKKLPGGKEMEEVERSMLSHIHEQIRKKKQAVRRLYVLRAAAACLLVAFSALLVLELKEPPPAAFSVVTAPRRKVTRINLPDGSVVWLNAGGKLQYPKVFGARRDIYLLNGEAFFDIKHDDHSPFTVHYGKLHARVLGTAFNIKYYKSLNDVRVTVVRGKVEVGSESESFGILTPDREIILDKKQHHYTRNIDSKKVSNWKARDINLYDVSFNDLMLTLENTYDIRVSYDREKIGDMITTIHFSSADSLNQVLDLIKVIHGLNYSIKGKEVILSKRILNR